MNPSDNAEIFISLLLPTRRHPDKLHLVLDSIESTVADPSKIVLYFYVDDDDADTIAFLKHLGRVSPYRFDISWHIASKAGSMGKMMEALHRVSRPARIYMPLADDYVFDTPNWDEVLVDIWEKHPDGVWLAYPHDPNSPGNVTFAIMGSRWLELTGRFLTSYFPFWFDDVWLDQVAQMIGRKIAVPIQMKPMAGKGKTPRMFNLWFWHQFFANTLDERIEEADRLRCVIYGENSDEFRRCLAKASGLAENFDRLIRGFSKSEVLYSEYILSSRYSQEQISTNLLYICKEADGVLHLCDKLLVNAGRDHIAALSITDNIACTSLPIRGLDELRMVKHGSSSVVRQDALNQIIARIREDLLTIKNIASDGRLPADFKLIMPEFTTGLVLEGWYRRAVRFITAICRKCTCGAKQP